MTLFLLRHGDIESKLPKRFIGQVDVALSQKGRDQARRWQAAFAKKQLERLYASDLARCAETARIIAGHEPSKVHLLPALREISLGKLEGLTMNFIREQLPEVWKQRGENMARYRPEGGESFEDVHRRVIPVFEAIARKHEGNILIVAHSGVNRIILCHVLGMPVSDLFRIAQPYGCLNTLELHGDHFQVTGINRARP